MISSHRNLTGHCIACVKETEPETPGQEESSTSQIRKQEEKEVLIMKNESKEEETDAQNWDDVGLEDTEENFGDEEIDFEIFDNTSSNSKSPIDESELPMETEVENIEEEISFGEEELANISSSCIDEVSKTSGNYENEIRLA